MPNQRRPIHEVIVSTIDSLTAGLKNGTPVYHLTAKLEVILKILRESKMESAHAEMVFASLVGIHTSLVENGNFPALADDTKRALSNLEELTTT